MTFLSKYGVARHIYIPMVKRGVVDHAVSADWTPAAGDVKISKDGGAAANVTNLPSAIAMGNSTIWDFSLTATEMQAAQIMVTIGDSATKAVEDSAFIIETFGNASAQLGAIDFTDGVRAGLTALPNANAEAAGGLYTRGSGAGQINQPANGQIDANAVKLGGTSQTGRDIGASVLISSGSGTGQLDVTSGVIKANLAQILGTALTETAGLLAGGFKKFFNVSSPVHTIASVDQTGDSYARLGAPAGASHAADVAAVKADTAAVKTQTDKLTFTVANQIDANVLDWKSSTAPAMTGDAYARLGAPAGASVSADIAAVKSDTAGVKSKTDSLTFTVAGMVDSNVVDWKGSTAPAMTGDAYARLGAPAGASVSADIAAVKVDTSNIYGKVDTEIGALQTTADAIKAKTDSLAFTVPGQLDANIKSVADTTVTGSGTSGDPWGP